ncbi:hypothetical protein B0O99DRAFT_637054 [Bisporella sp. PMI_857]|nr:hypothetical protein B0O99DRAFT_637054 [Bisporella sp. PMI_857]
MDGLWVRKRQRSRNDIFENAALNKRGWALQERLLSTRVLHYGKAEMYWECLTCAAHESSNNIHQSVEGSSSFVRSEGEDFKRCLFTCGPNSYSIIDGAYALWYRLVSQYSRRQLTKSSDMLPAIEGLAAKIATLTGSQYVSGIFTNDLSGLCWTQQKLQERVSIDMVYDLATGWSWASVGGPVIYPFVDQEYVASPFDAEFVRYEHSDECITFDCKVKTITSIHGYNEHAFVYDEHGWQGKWISCQLRRSQMFDAASLKLLAISICHRQWKPPFQPAYGHDKPLRIGKEIVYHGPRQCDCEGPVLEDAVYFLIVAPAEKPSTYRRLGVGVSNSAADCSNPKTTTPFSPSSRRRITLVQSPIHSTGFIEK